MTLDRAPGGPSRGGYSASQAPAFGGFPAQERRHGMPEPQVGRGALLNDIRNYSRPGPSRFNGLPPMSSGETGGGYRPPQAPAFDAYDRAPGSGFGGRSRGSSGNSMLDEYKQRVGGSNFGLRPTRPRSEQSFERPRNSVMDSMRDRMASRRAAIEPDEDEGDWEAPSAPSVPMRGFHRTSGFNPGMTQRLGG